MPELRQAGDVIDLDYPPFIDRVEDAVPYRPARRRRRSGDVRERLRRPRPIRELADSSPARSDTAARATT
jgi:hypothetical protein